MSEESSTNSGASERRVLRIFMDPRRPASKKKTLEAIASAIPSHQVEVHIVDRTTQTLAIAGTPTAPPPTPIARHPRTEQQESAARDAAAERLDANERIAKSIPTTESRDPLEARPTQIAKARTDWALLVWTLKECGVFVFIRIVLKAAALTIVDSFKNE